MNEWIVVNIGCIECGVSSNIVGVFSCKKIAEDVANVLLKKNQWRERGQNNYVVFEMPEKDIISGEYKEFITGEA